MIAVNRDVLIPYLDAYKTYLDHQEHRDSRRLMANALEDYKRGVAQKASATLNAENWSESEIGSGAIGERVIKAVQKNHNLVGHYQTSGFSDQTQKVPDEAEQLLYDLYHDRKDQDCFERVCRLFGRKYDLVSYLYFILDPHKYLPLRSSFFDKVFRELDINLQTSGRCSWENYQDFLGVVATVRDVMREHFQYTDIDLLDAHAFLWTVNLGLGVTDEGDETSETEPVKKKKVEVGAEIIHNVYGDGIISELTDDDIYVAFDAGIRIFPRHAIEKEYLRLK